MSDLQEENDRLRRAFAQAREDLYRVRLRMDRFRPGRQYIYVAGPLGMPSQHEETIQAAVHAAEQLRQAGLFPFVPHLFAYWGQHHDHSYECWMKLDLAWLARCDALLRLVGDSPGADREVRFAHGELEIPVFGSVEKVIEWSKG